MSAEQAHGWLAWGRARGATGAWLGGGEPTLRSDLPTLVRAARRLGYEDVVVQTNGLRLSYEAYADALVRAGLTEARVNVKSHDPRTHDALSGEAGAHALMTTALERLAARGVRTTADVLLTTGTQAELPTTVAFVADRGVTTVDLWLLSAADAPAASPHVPSVASMHDALRAARDVARARGIVLRSFHTPWCLLPEDLRELHVPTGTLGLWVVDPGGRPFAVEASPFEGGLHVAACDACAMRPRCAGLRADHVALHGVTDVTPIAR